MKEQSVFTNFDIRLWVDHEGLVEGLGEPTGKTLEALIRSAELLS